MTPKESPLRSETGSVLTERRLLTCPNCKWVHYAMTPDEKAVNDRLLTRLTERYQLSREEQELYESAYRQCLRCESPANEFLAASDQDIDRAEGHIVTPVFVDPVDGAQ
ncbi:MAG: hypothetical protein AB7G75_00940 [Candidatus Binatia bacterium]